MQPSPDRLATTLAQRAVLPAEAFAGPFQPPAPGSADARTDLKLLAFEAVQALTQRGTPEAEARLTELTGPDLWAGTVQDGTARGFMAALEEAISLCGAPPPEPPPPAPEQIALGDVLAARDLRRGRDLLVASGGARIRFTRKRGILLVDRAHDVNVENAICFEDRADRGTLDGFEPVEGERARLFYPGFLKAVHWEHNEVRDLLLLEGRLGRGAGGFPCRMRIEGRPELSRVQMSVAIENRHPDHRLRIRFVGLPDDTLVASRGTPGWESVLHHGRRFLAATLVRACGRLRVGEDEIAVPGAQGLGWIEHRFWLGGTGD